MSYRSRLLQSGAALAVLGIAGVGLFASTGRARAVITPIDDSTPVLVFSTLGDSRQDPVTADPTTLPLSGQDAIWLQNTKAWARIGREILDQNANLLVFNGDMVMGYGKADVPSDTSLNGILNSDLMAFYKQYGFWRGMAADLMERGTYVVPVPGNHETEWKAGGKIAIVQNENAWRANMSDLILDDARFTSLFGVTPTNEQTGDNRDPADGLTTDQSKLSYSFDFLGSHFAVINTDPVGADAHAPTHWLATDLAAAKARGVTHLFVFGHKPAYTYYSGPNKPLPSKPSGLDNDVPARDAFWNVIESNGAHYFCGHEHIFDAAQPTLANGGKSWQVIVGSGGSPFDALSSDVTINPQTDRDYAWATVKVFKGGTVQIFCYGFDDHFGPTKQIAKITVKP